MAVTTITHRVALKTLVLEKRLVIPCFSINVKIENETRDRIDWELNPIMDYSVLSISGSSNTYQTWGQISELLNEKTENLYVKRLCQIWDEWHLNDLTAGTKRQTNYLKHIKHEGDYSSQCEKLMSINLYEDSGYKYGAKWLVKPLPKSIIDEVTMLCQLINPKT